MLKTLEVVMLRESIGRIVFAAWMGVAAALLPHGATICAASGLSPNEFVAEATPKLTTKQRTDFEKTCGPPEEVALVVRTLANLPHLGPAGASFSPRPPPSS